MIYMIQKIVKNDAFEPEIQEYLALKSKTSRHVYSSALKHFLDFYRNKYGKGKTISQFLDRIFDEYKKPRRQQRRIAEIELVEYIDYLKQLKMANNSIRSYFGGLQNFLKFKGVTVSSIFIGNLPPSIEKPDNHKHEWKIEQIQEFIKKLPTMRDKAIAITLFQSGIAVNELCRLNYGHVQDELEAGIMPICIRLYRQKTGIEFKTFLGADSMRYLKLYLQTRNDLTAKSPLFTLWGSSTRISTSAIQQRFSEIAKKLSFLKNQDLENGYNPARPHSLRSAFKSRLVGKTSDDLVEFIMGHAIGGVKTAYMNLPQEELRQLYMDSVEPHLTIEKSSREELAEREGKELHLAEEAEKRIGGLEQSISALQTKITEQHDWIEQTLKAVGELNKIQEKNSWHWEQRMAERKPFNIKGKNLLLSRIDLISVLNVTEEEADEIWVNGIPSELEDKLFDQFFDREGKNEQTAS
jgi:integrase